MPASFGLTTIVIPTSGIRAKGLEFETHLARVGGDIVGHWVQRSPCVIVAETNACGFWSNGNCDSNKIYDDHKLQCGNNSAQPQLLRELSNI